MSHLDIYRIFPGAGIIVWVVCDEEGRLLMPSTDKEALVRYASEIAKGRPVFITHEDGSRCQTGYVGNG